MSGASSIYSQQSLWDIPSATSLPEEDSGPSLSDKPDGPTGDLAGPEVAHVHPSLKRAKARGLMMIVTSGLSGIPSSASAALQSSLESRLMQQLDSAGSTLFAETWKRKATPLRRRYWEHTASEPRTGDSAFTSLPTPQAADMTGGGQAKLALRNKRENGVAQSANLNDYAMLASVSTPTERDHSRGGQPSRPWDTGVPLTQQVALAAVPTPCANEDNKSVEAHLAMKQRMGERDGTHSNRTAITSLQVTAKLSGVPSPCCPNGGRSMDTEKMDATGKTLDGRKHTATLEHAVKFSAVATPTSYDADGGGSQTAANRKAEGLARPSGAAYSSQLRHEVMLANTRTPSASDAERGAHPRPNVKAGQHSLVTEASLASRSTPSARDWKDTSGMSETGVDPDGSTRSRLDQLPRQAQLAASGLIATGGTAATKSTGQLDPAYSRWLQGVPPEWDGFACTAMQSLSRKRKRSSRPT
jgi:hypothetical protein